VTEPTTPTFISLVPSETVFMVSSLLGAMSIITLLVALGIFLFIMYGIWRRRVVDENTIREASEIFIAGPLNINKSTRMANTVYGVDLDLGEKEFDALALLAAYEGEAVDIHTLHNVMFVEETDNIKESKNEVYQILDALLDKVNRIGDGFMKIEKCEKTNDFTFTTSWERGMAGV
jgi:hypothetical protein